MVEEATVEKQEPVEEEEKPVMDEEEKLPLAEIVIL